MTEYYNCLLMYAVYTKLHIFLIFDKYVNLFATYSIKILTRLIIVLSI